MNSREQFNKNHKRMNELQKLLNQVDYKMLGETAETKTMYEGLREKIVEELLNLNEEQKTLAKEIKKQHA